MCCIRNSYFSHGAGSGHNFFRKRTASSALSELRLFRQNVFGLNIRRSRFNLKRFSLETATCSRGIKRDNILEMKFVLFLIISSQPYDPIISYEIVIVRSCLQFEMEANSLDAIRDSRLK